ncbi:MAG: ABC transporter ATP-binding protein [Chitinophagaceae bacterium]|nr:ABC transporter ATP-binding protein [Chitinophagaceae bacterium]
MKDILKNTWTVLDKGEKKKFVTLVIADIVINVLDIVSLALLLWIIQFYIEPASNDRFSFFPGWLTDKRSAWFIVIFFLLFGLKNAGAYFISKTWYTFITGVSVSISGNNLSNYQDASFEEFVNTDSAIHIRKIGFQPFEFCQYILSGIQQVITQSVLILLTIAAIVVFNARLFLLLLAILLPPVIITLYFIRKRMTKAKKDIKTSSETSFKYLLDALKGYVEANIYNRNHFFLQRFINSRRIFSKVMFGSISIQQMPSRFIEVFAILGLFILIAITRWTGNNDNSMLITIGAFMAAAYKIIPGIVRIINISGQINAYEYSITDLVQNEKRAKRKKERKPAAPPASIDLRNIHFQYDEKPLIKGLSFSVERGDFVGITGDSGKGKTTVLNLLLGLLAPAKGEILFNKTPVDKDDARDFWPFISYVKQQPFLIHDTILRNITLEENVYDEKKLQTALDISGISQLTDISKTGLDKIITENGKNISGGQQQRIAIARALYRDASLIILDEPFNELDEVSECDLLKSFKLLSQKGKMIILITHNKKALSFCNKIVSLDGKEG